jgi:hypothetical protein
MGDGDGGMAALVCIDPYESPWSCPPSRVRENDGPGANTQLGGVQHDWETDAYAITFDGRIPPMKTTD